MRKRIVIALSAIFAVVTLSSFAIGGWYDCKTCNGKGWLMTRDCSRCGGKKYSEQVVNCTRCNGNGYIRDNYGDKQTCPKCDGSKGELKRTNCSACGGTGEEKMPCKTCNGKGKVWVDD